MNTRSLPVSDVHDMQDGSYLSAVQRTLTTTPSLVSAFPVVANTSLTTSQAAAPSASPTSASPPSLPSYPRGQHASPELLAARATLQGMLHLLQEVTTILDMPIGLAETVSDEYVYVFSHNLDLPEFTAESIALATLFSAARAMDILYPYHQLAATTPGVTALQIKNAAGAVNEMLFPRDQPRTTHMFVSGFMAAVQSSLVISVAEVIQVTKVAMALGVVDCSLPVAASAAWYCVASLALAGATGPRTITKITDAEVKMVYDAALAVYMPVDTKELKKAIAAMAANDELLFDLA